jgi:hypothetical protein
MEPGIYRGHDGVRDYRGRLGAVFEQQRVESVDVTTRTDPRLCATASRSSRDARRCRPEAGQTVSNPLPTDVTAIPRDGAFGWAMDGP